MEAYSNSTKPLKHSERSFQGAKVNKQSGTTDCGVFAAAYQTALTFGENPSAVINDHRFKHLSHHLLNCLEAKKMSLFPIIRQRQTASTWVTVNVYRGPDTREVMVACDKCKK